MAGNIFGKIITLTSFGESHGRAIGGILDGFPSGLKLDLDLVQRELDRRRPGQSKVVSSRNEPDNIEFLSGILDGTTLGTPVAFIVRNRDVQSSDLSILKMYTDHHMLIILMNKSME
jgi:chorismate synthase